MPHFITPSRERCLWIRIRVMRVDNKERAQIGMVSGDTPHSKTNLDTPISCRAAVAAAPQAGCLRRTHPNAHYWAEQECNASVPLEGEMQADQFELVDLRE